ncbi:reverse transcriptase [Cucumis melo var. makuwa]|uniref:Reverse transcriptase n=1 Tax=Cucumis melo var. makuwa TaxID=1194695 RepID=A0A5A7T4N0_CUCMM|nr:reverse transcriptase [Cucumis melo var. makuwa]
MQGSTQGPSVGESSTLGVRGGAGNEQFARTTQEIGRLDRGEPSDPEKAYGIEQLKKLGATVFEGSTDPADAENWLNMLEKCFDVINCPGERKVRLATFLLQKEAEGWWKSILARRSDARALDWQTFRGIFEDKYYPSTYCEAKKDEFLGLKQGSLSVAEYERKDTELSRYANVIVASESDRCRRFERGLRFEIRTPVTAIAKWTNFSQLVETALRVQQSITEEKSAVELSRGTSTASGFRGREQRRFTPGINISSRQDFKNRSGGQVSRNESIASTVRRIPCTSCGRNHRGQCLVGVGVCYQCGQPRHFKKDCPQLNMTVQRDQGVGSQTVEQSRVSVVPTEGTSGARQKGVVGRPRQQGKVYTMTQQEAKDAPDVITGTILICNVPADVLFDLVLVEGISLLVDLLPLELQRKEVVFRKPGFAEVVFRGMRKAISRSLISVLKAEKLLRKGCTAFLAHIVVVQREKLKPEDVPMVKEFLYVFPDDLSGKANLVADALSRKSRLPKSASCGIRVALLNELRGSKAVVATEDSGSLLAQFQVRSSLVTEIVRRQSEDSNLQKKFEKSKKGLEVEFELRTNGAIVKQGRLCVSNISELKNAILEEAHSSAYAMHPGSTKMYRTLKKIYWWSGMKQEIAEYVDRCLICQQVKPVRQRPGGFLNPLPVPEWKWEHITMDFLFGLPRTSSGHDSIWVIVDRLTKTTRFIPIKMTSTLDQLTRLYVDKIVSQYGVPMSIVSDRDPRFTSKFWPSLQKAMGTGLKFSTSFHPQTDGQCERTIQTLEDMLRACVLQLKGMWDTHLPLMEFAYNNNYQSSIGMTPYEALYGRPCRTPVCWNEVGERKLVGPELVQIMTNNIKLIRENLRKAQDQQKRKGKLSPRYIGPYQITERVGPAAYRLELPIELARIHDVFHVSMLRKYIPDPSRVLQEQPVELKEDLSYVEEPVQILDRKEQVLRNKTIPLIKVLWRHHGAKEGTWEPEYQMKKRYPILFS